MEPTSFDACKESLLKQLTAYIDIIKETNQHDAADINIFLKIAETHAKAVKANSDYLTYTLQLFNQNNKVKKLGKLPPDLLLSLS